MGKLVFEGDDKQLLKIAKSNRLRVKKHDLKMSLEIDKKKAEESKTDANPSGDNKSELPKGANDRIELIKAVTKVEDLKPFESDERATVKKAYDEKLAELTNEEE